MVLAYSQMHEWDGWWMLMAAGWLLIWGLVVWWVVSLVRARDDGRNDHGATAREVLDRRLVAETTEVFGAPVSAADLEAKLSPKKEDSPLPRMTAFDLLVEISKRVPGKSDVKLEVIELTIEPKKIYLKAVADSQASIDAVTKKLKEVDCFTDVQLGRTDTVNDGKQFTLTIPMKCM